MGKTHIALWAMVAVAWIGNAGYAAGQIGGLGKEIASGVVAAAMITFITLHSRHQFSRVQLLLFFTIIGVTAWLVESIGIATGLPFGHYTYSAEMAPVLGQVPVFVLLAYAFMGYLAYALALIYAGILAPHRDRVKRALIPVLAAAFMVIWDLSMDPLRATHEARWVWQEGGAYLGIPVMNFVGWFLVTWAFFQIFTWLAKDNLPVLPPQLNWPIPLMYAAFAGEYLMNPVLGTGLEALLHINGQEVVRGDFYTSVASVCMGSMIPVALGGLLLLWMRDKKLTPSVLLIRQAGGE